ncbi:MAG: hypothetical protein AMXMBFR64_59250 [Myxococcales bacterium]
MPSIPDSPTLSVSAAALGALRSHVSAPGSAVRVTLDGYG